MKNNPITLCNINSCTQCYSCVQVCPKACISMRESLSGFKIPVIDDTSCIKCGACVSVCHRLNTAVHYHMPIKCYAGWITDPFDRAHSSSGGVFTALAKKVISASGVVFGASMSSDLKVSHIPIETLEDITLLRGSKYLQSDLSGVYLKVKSCLNAGKKVLFTGTPCQISGLYSYLKGNPRGLITCDLVCHGVPSQASFDVWLSKIKINNATQVNFRFTKGWGFQLSYKSKKASGESKIILPYKGYYLKAFNKGLMFSEACYTCSYAQVNRVADITLGDFWGIGQSIPFNYPVDRGISMVLANTEKGLTFLESTPQLSLIDRPLDEAVAGNLNLQHPSTRPRGRDTYFLDSKSLNLFTLCKKYRLWPSLRDYLRVVKQILLSAVKFRT